MGPRKRITKRTISEEIIEDVDEPGQPTGSTNDDDDDDDQDDDASEDDQDDEEEDT